MSSSDLFISTSPSETRSRCGSGGMGGRRRLRWIGSTYLSSVLMHQFSPRATTAVLITNKALRNTRNKEKSWWQQQKFASFLSFAISSGTNIHTQTSRTHGRAHFDWGSVGWQEEATGCSRASPPDASWIGGPTIQPHPEHFFHHRSTCLCIFFLLSLVWEILKIIISFQLFSFLAPLCKNAKSTLHWKDRSESFEISQNFSDAGAIVTWWRAVSPSTLAVSMSAPPLLSMLRTSSLSPAAQAARKMQPAENLTFLSLAIFGNTDSRLVSESS